MKRCFMYIDDVIWVYRDIARKKPSSIFDNPFMKMLKTAHDKYGIKIQLNTFYRTDFFYGDDEFTLADMPGDYKEEFTQASNWLRLGFHAKQEYPDYPYINAKYQDVKNNVQSFKKEVCRFACERSIALGVIPHWNAMSREGCMAIADSGFRLLHASSGPTWEYNGDPASLAYGHALRLLNNRQPETKIFNKGSRDIAINNSLCGYNHIDLSENPEESGVLKGYFDDKIGIWLKCVGNGTCLNLCKLDEVEAFYAPKLHDEYISIGNHEQYFYPEYLSYQPEYADKVYLAAKLAKDNGFEFIFAEDLVCMAEEKAFTVSSK